MNVRVIFYRYICMPLYDFLQLHLMLHPIIQSANRPCLFQSHGHHFAVTSYKTLCKNDRAHLYQQTIDLAMQSLYVNFVKYLNLIK